ncbi:MAG TPA: chemotaxis protein CheW [Polyangiaceae bacterium]|nr:chemotaxis protein CheW [Polyangiaceae bacterium]
MTEHSGVSTSTSEAGKAHNAQLLTFLVDQQEYGVDILRVQEIRGWSAPMPIPGAPPYIKGVINIRGDVVPIADLRERLGLPALEHGATTAVVVLRVQYKNRERVMGVIVDAMSDVTTVPAEALRPPPTFHDSAESLTKEIAALEDKMITILDVDCVFGNQVG